MQETTSPRPKQIHQYEMAKTFHGYAYKDSIQQRPDERRITKEAKTGIRSNPREPCVCLSSQVAAASPKPAEDLQRPPYSSALMASLKCRTAQIATYCRPTHDCRHGLWSNSRRLERSRETQSNFHQQTYLATTNSRLFVVISFIDRRRKSLYAPPDHQEGQPSIN